MVIDSQNSAKSKRLGKFYSLANMRYLHSVLVGNRLYFTDPSEFNDPFEMIPAVFKTKTFKRVSESSKIISPEAVDRALLEAWEMYKEQYRKWGVSCFTEALDDIVMWSHYGDKHRGVCLIFDTTYKFFKGVMQVKYVSERPLIPVFRKDPQEIIEIMRCKLQLWSHEKEWRLFRKLRNRAYVFPKSSLKGIVFGCRCPAEDKDLILRRLMAGIWNTLMPRCHRMTTNWSCDGFSSSKSTRAWNAGLVVELHLPLLCFEAKGWRGK